MTMRPDNPPSYFAYGVICLVLIVGLTWWKNGGVGW